MRIHSQFINYVAFVCVCASIQGNHQNKMKKTDLVLKKYYNLKVSRIFHKLIHSQCGIIFQNFQSEWYFSITGNSGIGTPTNPDNPAQIDVAIL